MSDEVSCVYQSPMGPLKLAANSQGICRVKFLFGGHGREPRGSVESEGEHDHPSPTLLDRTEGNPDALQHLKTCFNWLDAYFNCKLNIDVPKPTLVIPHEGNFFNTVWTVLASTAVGETLTYRDLAKLAGRPHAARAVGNAMKHNRLPLLVPCHRVLKSNKTDIGSYSAGEGTKTKQWLLDHEKKMAVHTTSNAAV